MRLNFKTLTLLAVAALCLAGASPEFAAAQGRQKFSVVVSGFGSWFYLQQHIAIGAGLYQEEGLEPEVIDVNSGTRQAAAVMGGSAELGQFSFPHAIKSVAKGGGLVAIGGGYDAYPLQLVLSNGAIKKSGIESTMSVDDKVRRLKGLNIGISSPGASTDLFMRTILIVRGLDPDKDVSLQPVGSGAPMVGALEAGAIDGFTFGSPFSTSAVSKGIAQMVIDPMKGELPEFRGLPYQIVATSRQTLESKPDLLLKAMRALAKAQKLTRENPDAVRRAIRPWFKDLPEEEFNAEFNVHVIGIPASTMISEDQYNRTVHLLNLTEKEKITSPFADVVSSDLAARASKEIFGR
jgi:NitT/TauT family transport system substrate-binding protein